MFEGVLYFVLGFLASALIALMVSPAIWNRAVVLTKRRIESSVPLTLNEVQADKDQLRAEFAMSTRRLELSIEELQEKAARQVIEINRKRDELAKLAAESREKIRSVEELEGRSAEMRARLSERGEDLEKVSIQLNRTREQLEEKALELEKLQRAANDARSEADSRRIELVAKQTTLDDTSDRLRQLNDERNRLQDENRRLAAQLASAQTMGEDANDRIARLQKANADLEEKLQRRERDISEMRETGQSEADSANELTRLLMEERKKVNNLEAQIAKSSLHMEALLSDASNENVSKAVDTLNAEKTGLRNKLKEITAERDTLQRQLNDYQHNSGLEWETERKENAVLRERMNDLAAQVTAMTAALEGPGSPINDIIAAAEKSASKGTGSETQATTLADRVRALQESARIREA